MTTIKLKKNDEFVILDYANDLYFRVGDATAVPPFTQHPQNLVINPGVEYWIMTADEDIKVDDNRWVQDGNGLIYDYLVGSRPTKARRSR